MNQHWIIEDIDMAPISKIMDPLCTHNGSRYIMDLWIDGFPLANRSNIHMI